MNVSFNEQVHIFALITSKRLDHGRLGLLRLILSFMSLLKFKIERNISYINTVDNTQILLWPWKCFGGVKWPFCALSVALVERGRACE